MFTGIRLRNYKSLVNFSADFTHRKNQAKKIIIIYGENGIGKSNLASSFYTLIDSMKTLSIRKVIQVFIEKREENSKINENFMKHLSRNLRDTESIISNCKTINSKGNMELEFNFIIDGKKGSYLLVYDDSRLIHEKLSFVLNKNKTILFDLSDETKNINKNLFLDQEYENEIKDLIKMYQGKHSLLSIIVNELEEKDKGYLKAKIHRSLIEVISFFMRMSIKEKSGEVAERGKMGLSHLILGNLTDGKINIEEESELDKAERFLNLFFTYMYSDIKEVFYKRYREDNQIKYELFFRKKIYNQIIDVNYELESTGTQHLITILPFLLMCIEGSVVVIDEIDAGIHDLLINTILNSIIDSINGQLIVTTHNTMLLDSKISPENIYTFVVDRNANKELVNIADFENRTHPYLNYRKRYLEGMYGGIPHIEDIDFDELHNIFEE
ncbi:AAA family ATPase [Merdibacter massiliensis]|uniref:AAA family ATPase n=1 Tax=Merdibacter massiliensis TaxID=1871030 RepID=UPI00096A972A|nr:AAA family ATPase [Merdibacter massiliensis]